MIHRSAGAREVGGGQSEAGGSFRGPTNDDPASWLGARGLGGEAGGWGARRSDDHSPRRVGPLGFGFARGRAAALWGTCSVPNLTA
jgi:hypothetical protein